MCDHLKECRTCAYNTFVADYTTNVFEFNDDDIDKKFLKKYPEHVKCSKCLETFEGYCNECGLGYCSCGLICEECDVHLCSDCYNSDSTPEYLRCNC